MAHVKGTVGWPATRSCWQQQQLSRAMAPQMFYVGFPVTANDRMAGRLSTTVSGISLCHPAFITHPSTASHSTLARVEGTRG